MRRFLNVTGDLSVEDVKSLLNWKFKFLSNQDREQLVSKIQPKMREKLVRFNEFRNLNKISDFEFGRMWELCWNLAIEVGLRLVLASFLLHIARPWNYPMADRHVLRAFDFIRSGDIQENPLEKMVDSQAVDIYQSYATFFFKFMFLSHNGPREIDKALWCYGRQMKQDRTLFQERLRKASVSSTDPTRSRTTESL